MASNALAIRIDELATKRLLPLEMFGTVTGVDLQLVPAGMQFMRINADSSKGLYTLNIDAQTNNAGQVSLYQSALKNLPGIEDVDVQLGGTLRDVTPFKLIIKFKPDALKGDKTS
jgi:hypothetical protein